MIDCIKDVLTNFNGTIPQKIRELENKGYKSVMYKGEHALKGGGPAGELWKIDENHIFHSYSGQISTVQEHEYAHSTTFPFQSYRNDTLYYTHCKGANIKANLKQTS